MKLHNQTEIRRAVAPLARLAPLVSAAAVALTLSVVALPVWAQSAGQANATATEVSAAASSEAFVRKLTDDVLAAIRQDRTLQAGDVRKVVSLVDTRILPHVNFQRMTASAVGRHWRQATPDQQKRLQEEFKNLLVYTYAGAVAQIRDQSVEVRPVRARPTDTEVVVRTVVRGRGDPIQLDYRLERAGDGWKIYDVNVLGAWLVQTYQSSFAQEVSASGIEGLIARLAERNKQLAERRPSAG